ncbi:MAG: hypothetical protein Q7V11_13235, partial [Pseudotabrizicola sp.]|nr:hypothetical protein [Pseudotabrizicola sp.]
GNGNDRLFLRDGDIGTGGAGADTFVVDYYDTVSEGGEVILTWDNVAVRITDFTPGVDRIEIALLGTPADSSPELFAVDGGTMIRFGSDDVVFLAGVAPSAIPTGDIVIFPT